jgi:hypothetical protein
MRDLRDTGLAYVAVKPRPRPAIDVPSVRKYRQAFAPGSTPKSAVGRLAALLYNRIRGWL